MVCCPQLTDAALAPLAATLQELNMSDCTRLTSARLAPLTQLRVLKMRGCAQNTLGDAAFATLRNLRELDMSWCDQHSFTDACLVPLRGTLRYLDVSGCRQLSEAALEGITGLRGLRYEGSGASKEAARRAMGPRGT